MVLRVVFFALMALGLVGFGTVAWISSRPPTSAAEAAAPPAMVSVLTAAHVIHAGTLLRPEDLVGKEMPRAEIGPDAMLDTPEARRDLSGAMVRRGFGPGELIRPGDVMRPGDHGFLAAVLLPGMRALTVGVDAITGTAGLIWPGDRVDLILTQVLPDTSGPLGHRVAAETVLSDVRVIAIDQQLVQGASPGSSEQPARTVTLEVDKDQAERVSVATRLGRLSLAVRSAEKPQTAAQIAAAHAASQSAAVPAQAAAAATATVWASDVSAALGAAPSKTVEQSVHVFSGTADGKEFHF
jgi:pilus assembly protein CpaB